MAKPKMTLDEWLQLGLDNRWCGPPVCATHDGIPSSAEEDEEGEEHGEPPCIHIVRMYEDEDVAKAIEENHSPSVWRKPRRGN